MRVKLGEVCTVVSGTTPKSANPEYWNGNIDWITPAELNDDVDIIYESQRKITEKAVIESGLKPFPPGTVILSSRAPIGKVAISGVEMYCNQGFKNLICSERIYNRYLFWFLKKQKEYLNSLGRGATFKEISKSIVEDIEIFLPVLEEQRKIAAVLDKVCELIALRRKQLERLNLMVKARFVEMFGDRWLNNMNWPTMPLRIAANFYNGKAHEKDIAFDGKFILVTSKYIASDGTIYRKTDACLFPLQIGDICMVMSDVPNGRALAKCISIGKNNTYSLNQRICCFRDYSLDSTFFFHLLNRHEYLLSFDDGDSQTNLRKDDLLNCPIIVPPMELQKQFANFSIEIDKLKLPIQQSLDTLEVLKKSLMQEYFG